MAKKLKLENLLVKSFVTHERNAKNIKGGATNNPTVIFAQGCCTGFTCGPCAYPAETYPAECAPQT